MTLVEQKFIIEYYQEKLGNISMKVIGGTYPYKSKEQKEKDIDEMNRLGDLVDRLYAVLHSNIEKACQEMLNDKK